MKELDGLSALERALVLMKVAPFEDLSAQQVSLIAVHTLEVELIEDEALETGTPAGDAMFVVMSGSVSISLNGKRLATVGPGDYFGLYALARTETDTVEFRALERVHALRLGREDFEQTIADYPEFAIALIRSLLRRVRKFVGVEG